MLVKYTGNRHQVVIPILPVQLWCFSSCVLWLSVLIYNAPFIQVDLKCTHSEFCFSSSFSSSWKLINIKLNRISTTTTKISEFAVLWIASLSWSREVRWIYLCNLLLLVPLTLQCSSQVQKEICNISREGERNCLKNSSDLKKKNWKTLAKMEE